MSVATSSYLNQLAENHLGESTINSDTFEDMMNACLSSLNVPETRYRVANVERVFAQTYAWIFQGKVGFEDWLRERDENRIYWIQGKPGSGKSTAMKYALGHPKTLCLLAECDSNPWIMAGFFFYDRGSLVQKSIDGLLSEVLYQILEKRQDLLALVLPIYQKEVKPKVPQTASHKPIWSTKDLEDALLFITRQDETKLNICFFVDALDEHAGNHRDLLRILKEIASPSSQGLVHTKLCVASRPENVFLDAFGGCPGFAIHQYTREDIQMYAFDRMRSELSLDMSSETVTRFQGLLQEIVDKARGVFIWVRLVIDELIDGICEGDIFGSDPIDKLHELLADIPDELRALYRRAILRVQKRHATKQNRSDYQYEVYVMFQIALCSDGPLSLGEFVKATLLITSRFSKGHLVLPEDALRRRLASRSGGLLEAGSDDLFQSDVVKFIHQTAKEFAQGEEITHILFAGYENYTRDNGHILLLRYYSYIFTNNRSLRSFNCASDIFHHAQAAERTMKRSYAEDLETLISGGTDRATQTLDALSVLFEETAFMERLTRDFQDRDTRFELLLLAVYEGLVFYLKDRFESVIALPGFTETYMERLLICAAHSNSYERERILRFLFEKGAKADCTFEGHTPLSHILPSHNGGGPISVIDVLLAHGADPNQKIWLGEEVWTLPIILAVGWEASPLVQVLLRYGADPRKEDCDGEDAIFSATSQVDSKIRDLLQKHQQEQEREESGGKEQTLLQN